MIDLHCHILPALDDGAATVAVSLEMAKIAVADGITHVACTPHVFEGKYPNTSATILPAIKNLQTIITQNNIALQLLPGADVHVAWNLPEKLLSKKIPTLNGSRYFLLEPPHHILPPRLDVLVSRLLECEFIPIITHPERLAWLRNHYDVIIRLYDMGCLMQLTADSITGGFGANVQWNSEKMLTDGMVSLVASDGHSSSWRKPLLSIARKLVDEKWGSELADELFIKNPTNIIANKAIVKANARGKISLTFEKGNGLLKMKRNLLHRFWGGLK